MSGSKSENSVDANDGSVVVLTGYYDHVLLFDCNNKDNDKDFNFEEKHTLKTEFNYQSLIEAVNNQTLTAELKHEAKAVTQLTYLKAEGETSYRQASTLYEEHTSRITTGKTYVKTEECRFNYIVGPRCHMKMYRLKFMGPAGVIDMRSVIIMPGHEKPQELEPVKLYFKIKPRQEKANPMLGYFRQNNGTVLTITNTTVGYRGMQFPRHSLNPSAFWTQEGAIFWYYIWTGSSYYIFKYLAGYGFHEARPLPGTSNKFQQKNGTVLTFELNKSTISYRGSSLKLETLSSEPHVCFNMHGLDRWYYIKRVKISYRSL